MFLTGKILDLVVKTKDDAYALALSAFNESHQIAIGAKENEIRYLKTTLEEVRKKLDYERAKSDGLVDRLLVRDAQVAAVSPAAVELAKHKDVEAIKVLRDTFAGLNDIGEISAPKEPRAFELAGGSAVKRGV